MKLIHETNFTKKSGLTIKFSAFRKLLQLLFLILFLPTSIMSQDDPLTFSGLVVNENDEPLIGATVNWQDTTIGGVTDLDGWFTIDRIDTINPYILEIKYVGYETAVVEILPEEDRLQLVVQENATIQDIVVETRNRANFTSTLDPLNIETIGAGELRRAACCNLSESFENNATVNVSFTDAVTGAKEIEMLGLRGTYTQMMIENRPSFNRLGRAYGLEYIPGTFIQAIQISKGASSVKKGVQGITGQINTELIKPWKAPLLFINLFGNYTGRVELNLQLNYRLTPEWSTGLLMHGNYYGTEIDYNKDSFLDIPQKKQANVISRWAYKAQNIHFEINAQGIWDSRNGGQTLSLFEKAFDSLNLSFLHNALEKINFGPIFRHWIKTIYSNISSCVINNGHTSPYFPVTRGVRQGDPLSSYFYIIVAEYLATRIRNEQNIKGIMIGNSEIKMTMYADDTTVFLSDDKSVKKLFHILDKFNDITGLKVNREKTQGLWLGENYGSEESPYGI